LGQKSIDSLHLKYFRSFIFFCNSNFFFKTKQKDHNSFWESMGDPEKSEREKVFVFKKDGEG
jgi:hypothetical protein